MKATTIANWEEALWPIIRLAPSQLIVSKYSEGRLDFLKKLKEEILSETFSPPEDLSVTLWGIKFKTPLMNSAGMFKNGECYEMVAKQGAGAYLGGTGTWSHWLGNVGLANPVGSEKNIVRLPDVDIQKRRDYLKRGIYLPFVPYRDSHAASNCLGLPNDGDRENSQKAALERVENCPVGWSLMGSPDFQADKKLKYLVKGMWLYGEVGVDFLEMNESCPNTSHGKPQDDDIANRLRYVKENFLNQRQRRIPVIVKFSNDTQVEQLPALLDLLFELDYDGVNFGNTSTNYDQRREKIHPSERRIYDFFTKTFGGGVSGNPLKESSLELASRAVEYLREGAPKQEFHVIRTGGIENLQDIRDSQMAGISLNQWYTGYFRNFSKHGHEVYMRLFENSS